MGARSPDPVRASPAVARRVRTRVEPPAGRALPAGRRRVAPLLRSFGRPLAPLQRPRTHDPAAAARPRGRPDRDLLGLVALGRGLNASRHETDSGSVSKGTFWLPSDPAHRVVGTLKSSFDDISLALERGGSASPSGRRIDVLHGVVDGGPVTLHQVLVRGTTSSSDGTITSQETHGASRSFRCSRGGPAGHRVAKRREPREQRLFDPCSLKPLRSAPRTASPAHPAGSPPAAGPARRRAAAAHAGTRR